MESEVVRGKPLTKDETKFLVGLVEINKILLSKTTNATNNKMKNEEWIRVTNHFNATASNCRRTPQQLRLKWENLKKNARKHCAKIRMNRIQTGGGVPEYIPPDDILDRVAAVLGSTASGFIVPFGGDKEPELVELISVDDGDVGGDEPIGGQAGVLPLDSGLSVEGITSIPLCIGNGVIDVTEYEIKSGPSVNQNETATTTTPKRLTLNTPRTEFLAEAAYISVDPYQRMKLGENYPCDMIGGQVAKIIESKNLEYPVGTWVMGHFGWRTHTITKPENEKYCKQKPYMYTLPDFGDLPISLAVGSCGRVGNTAYFGFTQICQPKPGETVVISGAAGAVGCQVGQIAKIFGCRVIGFAGSDEKTNFLVKELGFDCAANYKTTNLKDFLKENAPNGVDCYFDNVGGEISSTVISQMNEYGRVAVCGAISTYNETDPEKRKATVLQPFIVGKQIKIEGFLVNRYADRTVEGVLQNLQWIKEGKLKYKEHITVGFESTADAFIGLFKGENIGKAIVKVK